jgi:hypothetical protein
MDRFINFFCLSVILIFFIFSEGCVTGDWHEDKNITVRIVNIQVIDYSLNLMKKTNVTLNISNSGSDTVKMVKIHTYYCNNFQIGRDCINTTFDNIGDLKPMENIQRFIEYDRDAVSYNLQGEHKLSYNATSFFVN